MTDQTGALGFPDGPRSELDRALAEVMGSAQRVLETQGRLRSLLSATTAVTEGLDLAKALRRIAEAAMGLVGARYGAMGVIAPDGTLEQFIHVGMPADAVERIGHLPEGHGLLGALIDDQRPIRLEHLQDDPRSIGFPPNHPPMESFLGVPIRVRGEVYGNLYLAERAGGPFSAEDEELLIALAASAGVAIDNARLYERSKRHQAWSAASAEVTGALLDGDIDDALALLAERMTSIADAALVCVVLPGRPGTLRVSVARGELAAEVEGLVFDERDTLAGRSIAASQPILADAAGSRNTVEDGPSMALPLRSSGDVRGAVTVTRHVGAPAFRSDDLEMAADFADQASVALELAATRADRQRLDLMDDRARIARDLHDHVIQRLFGAGLSLQTLASSEANAVTRAQLMKEVGALDEAIADIRTAIFAMSAPSDVSRPSLRHRVLDLVGDLGTRLGLRARVSFGGPVDLLVAPAVVDDVLAVVREGLTNVAKHANASTAEVSIEIDDLGLTIELRDDGDGVDGTATRSSGTANLRQRAQAHGGAMELVALEPAGTMLRWSVPTAPAEGGAQ
jgi:signal transduction histidine kinase